MHAGLARALATETVNRLDVMDDMLKVMWAQVTVRPERPPVRVEGHDTLLQAGLRAGLKLNYGCGNGTCGMCKVRVIAGEVARVMPSDYPLSEAEKAQGYTLMCAHTAASSELTLETLEAGGPQDIPPQQIVTTLRQVRELAPDTRLLHLQTPRSHRLRFLAGQSVTLGLAGRAAATTSAARCRWPAAPATTATCTSSSPATPTTRFARRVFDDALQARHAGQPVGPGGEFVLAEGERPLVFAACDPGFGPVKSLIEHALARDEAPSIALFWLATRPDGHFMANQCRAWSAALDSFEHQLATTATPPPARTRWRRRSAPTSSTSLATSTWPDPRLRAARCTTTCARPAFPRPDPHGGALMAPPDAAAARLRCASAAPAPAEAPADPSLDACSGGEAFALRVLGDSMAPEFNEGEIIIIEPEGLAARRLVRARLARRRMDLPPVARRPGPGACTR